jgi:crotonobetainyl-CoA:carnitine CoA-transferase CaiB-like acyl-CoA transferase
MGAQVIKLEAPAGDPIRRHAPGWKAGDDNNNGLSWLYTNTNKKSVRLDIDSREGQQTLRQLARKADLIIETLPPGKLRELGLSYASLREQNPALVLTSITAFGQSGPHSHFKSSDIVASAMGGLMYVTGEADEPPVKLVGSQAWVMASTIAASSSLIALRHSDKTGYGQHVDISIQEAVLAVTSIAGVGKWLDDGVVPVRRGTGLFASVPSGTYPCRDGSIYIMVNRPMHWQVLARWVNEVTANQEVLDPMFDGPSSARQPYRELLDIFIGELTCQYTVQDFYREGQQRHLAVTPLGTANSIARDKHLNQRQFFVDLAHGDKQLRYPGPPYRFTETPWRLKHCAPGLGQHDDELSMLLDDSGARALPPSAQTGGPVRGEALAGLRVVEFSAGMAGPWIGRFMANCGADVIKIESKGFPDVTRLYVPPRSPELGIQSQLRQAICISGSHQTGGRRAGPAYYCPQ